MQILRKFLTKSGQGLLRLEAALGGASNFQALQNWYRDNGEKNLRLSYPLNTSSVVFDLGGYEGQWASDIYAKYQPSIYIFEPVPIYAQSIRERFKQNDKLKVFSFGLAAQTHMVSLSLEGASSSVFKKKVEQVEVQMIAFDRFIQEQNIEKIDLIKINIEGGEYELLDLLISSGYVKSIENIQVQFHEFVPNAQQKLKAIYQNLSQTHQLTYHYPFVWENWQRQTENTSNKIKI